MNRKMRSKLNNARAKALKERPRCPMAGRFFPADTGHCDACGETLVSVAVSREPEPDRRRLH